MPVIVLLTATGGRPDAFAMCERLMLRQDYAGPVRWVIVDDCEPETPFTFHRDGWTVAHVHPEPRWKPGQITQARNLLAGLELADDGDTVVVIEDDDWYAPDYLTTVLREMGDHELAGESHARYYNLGVRHARHLMNSGHASLCSTAVRGMALKRLRDICRRAHKFIDLELWRTHADRHLFNAGKVVGIKGLPGRGGIGAGHRPSFKGTPDPEGRVLRQWVGDDMEWYWQFAGPTSVRKPHPHARYIHRPGRSLTPR